MFYGYESESQMRQYNPLIADRLIAIATKTTRNVCSRDKRCVGSIDGKEYIYEDGSKDFGRTISRYSATLDNHQFMWFDESQNDDTP